MASNQKTVENQAKVTHRVRITAPIVVEIEVWQVKSAAKALAIALETIADRLQPTPIGDRYVWSNEGGIDAFNFGGDIKHVMLSLKPVPELEEEEEEEEEVEA